MYFESHAHYDDEKYDGDREELLEELCRDVDFVVNIGADMESSRASAALAEKYDYIYAAIGVHPHEAGKMRDEDFDGLRSLAKSPKVVAVGEIGLDYYYDNSPREIQVRRFREQLQLAAELGLPVVIHSRDAAEQTFDILSEGPVRRGVIHCYSGSPEMAAEYVKMGFMIGVGGVVTYKNARKLVETVENIGIESILLETDCPYLSPEPKRGTRNSSQNLCYIAEKISQIKQISHEEVAFLTRENARRLFSI